MPATALNYTDWLSRKPAIKRDWEYGYITVPTFNVSLTGGAMNASVIVTQFNYVVGQAFAFLRLPTKQSGHMLCIRHRVGSVVTRYKLWDDPSFTGQCALYNGEVIQGNCVIEVWTLKDQANVTSSVIHTIRTSLRRAPLDFNTIPTDSLYSIVTGIQHSNQNEETTKQALPDDLDIVADWVKTPSLYPTSGNPYSALVDEVSANNLAGTFSSAAEDDIIKNQTYPVFDGSQNVIDTSFDSFTFQGAQWGVFVGFKLNGHSAINKRILEITNAAETYRATIWMQESLGIPQIAFQVYANPTTWSFAKTALNVGEVCSVFVRNNKFYVNGVEIGSHITPVTTDYFTKVAIGSDVAGGNFGSFDLARAAFIQGTAFADNTQDINCAQHFMQASMGYIPLAFSFDSDLQQLDNA